MQLINNKRNSLISSLVLSIIILASAAFVAGQDEAEKGEFVQLPAACSGIRVPAGNSLSFRVYATGYQYYQWLGGRWNFVAPNAKLFADESFRALVGDHFAGPTWQNATSSVVGARVDGCSPDATAIPWLLVRAVSTDGKGVFAKTTFIQRVNTAGGLEPSGQGNFEGETRKIPYLAEYYFYKASPAASN